MGCLILLLALISPRLALVAMALLSDILSRAFDGVLLPLIGFFLLPWTTLAYAGMWQLGTRGVTTVEMVIVVVALLADLASYGSARDY